MKMLRQLFFFLLSVIAVAFILTIVVPTKQKVKRDILINKPVEEVYSYLSRLENFNKWSVWSQNDSSLKNSISGTDGTTGAENHWTGDPELSGEGNMKIITLKLNEKIKYHLSFKQPKPMEAGSDFELESVNGQTKVTWIFTLETARPWNIFNLFSSLDKKMGVDFEDGLKNLKNILEGKPMDTPVTTYEVKQMNFPATTFALYRQQVAMNEIAGFYAEHLPKLFANLSTAGVTPGTPTGLFYEWDEKSSRTDMAAAIPVPADYTSGNDSIKLSTIAGSKAVYVDYYGAYDKTQEAYKTIDKYLADNKLKQKSPVIEQYMNDPQVVKDTAQWHTRIIFLVD